MSPHLWGLTLCRAVKEKALCLLRDQVHRVQQRPGSVNDMVDVLQKHFFRPGGALRNPSDGKSGRCYFLEDAGPETLAPKRDDEGAWE